MNTFMTKVINRELCLGNIEHNRSSGYFDNNGLVFREVESGFNQEVTIEPVFFDVVLC